MNTEFGVHQLTIKLDSEQTSDFLLLYAQIFTEKGQPPRGGYSVLYK